MRGGHSRELGFAEQLPARAEQWLCSSSSEDRLLRGLRCNARAAGLGLRGKGDAMGTRGAGQGKEGGWEGGGIKHLLHTLEPLQRLKQVKSRSFNGNTSEITSCKPCVPVTAPSPQCPFVPATSLSAGRGANTRLRHCHQLPRIPKCLEKATAPSVSSALWSGRAWGEQGSVLQPTCGSSQPVTLCKRTCCVADTSTPVPTVCWVRVHSLQQVCGWTLRVKTACLAHSLCVPLPLGAKAPSHWPHFCTASCFSASLLLTTSKSP